MHVLQDHSEELAMEKVKLQLQLERQKGDLTHVMVRARFRIR